MDNNGVLIKDIHVANSSYYLKPFEDDEESLKSIVSLYSNYYINSMVTSIVPMSEASYKQKLDYFVSLNKNQVFGLFNICNQETNKSVGLYGLKRHLDYEDEFSIAYVSKLNGIVKPVSKEIVKLAFELLGASKLHGDILSYNSFSHKMVYQIGMVDNGISLCENDYVKDSYLTNFVLTKERYEEIKQRNGGQYNFLKFPKDFKLKDMHSKARYLHEAIDEFKQTNQINRLKHCIELDLYKQKNYPRLYNKEKGC